LNDETISRRLKMLERIWKQIERNRFTVVLPIALLGVWLYCVGCTPTTASPLNPAVRVTAAELEIDFLSWQAQQEVMLKRFDLSRQEIEGQKEQWAAFQEVLMKLSTGAVADLPGLMQLLLGGGFVGLLADRLRASGVIGKQKAIIKKTERT